jgi:hypothetical protein
MWTDKDFIMIIAEIKDKSLIMEERCISLKNSSKLERWSLWKEVTKWLGYDEPTWENVQEDVQQFLKQFVHELWENKLNKEFKGFLDMM